MADVKVAIGLWRESGDHCSPSLLQVSSQLGSGVADMHWRASIRKSDSGVYLQGKKDRKWHTGCSLMSIAAVTVALASKQVAVSVAGLPVFRDKGLNRVGSVSALARWQAKLGHSDCHVCKGSSQSITELVPAASLCISRGRLSCGSGTLCSPCCCSEGWQSGLLPH